MLVPTRRHLPYLMVILVIVFGMLPLSVVTAQQVEQPVVIVNTSFQNVRSGPGAMYSIIGTVPGGTEMPVVGRNQDTSWWQAVSPFGVGWISAEFVLPRGDFRVVPVVNSTGILAQPRVAVIQKTANVFVFPDVSAALLGLALVGSELPVVGQTADGTWWQIETNIGFGWVLQSEVALRGSAVGVPIVAASRTTEAVILPVAPPMDGQGGGGEPSAPAAAPVNTTPSTTPGIADPTRAVVYAYQLAHLKTETRDGSATVTEMPPGDRAELLEWNRDGSWILVLYMGDVTGWVRANTVAISDPTDWRTQVWFGGPGYMDLLSEPDREADVVVTIPDNQRFVLTNTAQSLIGDWFYVEHDMGAGWAEARSFAIITNGYSPAAGAAVNTTMATDGSAGVVAQTELSGAIIPPSLVVVVPEPARTYVIVNTSFLHVRTGPGANYTSLGTVSGSTEMDVLASTPDGVWFQIRDQHGTVGWINSEFVIFRGEFANVSIISYEAAVGQIDGPQVIVSAPVNVYLGAGVETGLLGTAPAGLVIPVAGRTLDSNWLLVQTSSGNGWVIASTVTFRGDYALVPVIQ